MGTRINGLILEIEEKQTKLIRKKKSRRSHSAPPFYQGKKKFFATCEFSRKAAGINNIKTVHDVSLMPGNLSLICLFVLINNDDRKCCKETAAFCRSYLLGASQRSSHQCDQSSSPSCGDGVFSDERPSVKMKLVNIWNSKLQTQGECTSTHDGESKEEFALTKTQSILDSGTKWRDFCPETTSGTGTENRKNQDTKLNVTSGILHFVGDSLVPDTVDKNCLEGGANVLQQVDKKFIPIVAGTTLAIIDQ